MYTHLARVVSFSGISPKNGAEAAVLENFSDFMEKLFLKNEIKSKNLVT